MTLSNDYYPDTLRTLAFGSISGSYADVGSVTGFPYDQIVFSNSTNADLIVSFDGGTTDHMLIPTDQTVYISPMSGNIPGKTAPRTPPVGSQFAVKDNGTATTRGSIGITGFYER